MSFAVNRYTSKSSVTVHTWRGETYELAGDLYSWTTTKSFTTGTFKLSLTPGSYQLGKQWSALLKPMDYVEIRASKTGQKVNGEYPIIMRGFLDSPNNNLSLGQGGGLSEPRIVLTGTDYTKLLNRWQILYLFTQNVFQKSGAAQLKGIAAEYAGFGLFANFKIPLFANSVNEWITAAFANLAGPLMQGLQAHNYPTLPDFRHDFTFPHYSMNGLAVASYTGSYYNLLQYASSPPWGELFVRDDAEGPTLVGRMAPYKTITGATPAHGRSRPSSGDVLDVDSVVDAQTDADLYTYFLTWAADGQLFNMTQPTFLPGLSNGVMTSKAKLYGINPLQLDTPWISIAQSNGKPAKNTMPLLQQAADLNAWLIATLGDVEQFWSGSIHAHGDEALQVGTYRTVPEKKREYYLSQVTQNFQYANNGWDATLQGVRGWDVP